jgi:hypothetical protein
VTIWIGAFDRAQSSGTWTAGPPYYVPVLADWLKLDQNSSQIINGDEGGTWAPQTAQITIAGGGLVVTGPTVISDVGGTLESTAAGAFGLTSTEWPVLGPTHAFRSRTIVSSCLPATVNTTKVGQSGAYPIIPNLNYGSPQTVLVPGAAFTLTVPIRCHDGATLSSVVVSWIVSTPQGTPPTLPKFRVVQIDVNGVGTPMSSTAAGADANGYFTPTVGSGGWYNNGLAQSCTLTVDTDNVISLATYEYVLEIQEQQGQTGFPFSAWVFAQTPNLVATTNVVPRGAQTVDGVSSGSQFVLLTNQTDPTQNGLWGASSTLSWVRTLNILPYGAFYYINDGALLSSTFWQQQATPGAQASPPLWDSAKAYTSGQTVAPVGESSGFGLVALVTTPGTSGSSEPAWPTTAGGVITDNTVVWTMQTNSFVAPVVTQFFDPNLLNTGCLANFAAFGNIWLPVACNFEDIADCRFD